MMTAQPSEIEKARRQLGPKTENSWNGSVLYHKRRREVGETYGKNLPKPNEFRPKDVTAKFKLVGGKYHDIEIRAEFPFEPITFPTGETYHYSDEPFGRRSKRHVYILKDGS